jgi:hypothetical protein
MWWSEIFLLLLCFLALDIFIKSITQATPTAAPKPDDGTFK